jgi:hypothetical protein
VIRALLVVALLAGSAHADTVFELPKTKATLTLADAWRRTVPAPPGLVDSFRHDAGLVLAVTRADVSNGDAWNADKKAAYADQVEKGIKSKIPGYKRITRKFGDVNGVPMLDVEARRSDGAMVCVRVLMFRSYAISVSIEVPKGSDISLARAVTKRFAPPKDKDS